MHYHKLVLRYVCSGCRQVGGGLGLDALEVHVTAFPFLLLPGHADERALDVVVDDFRTAARTPFHLLLVSGVAWAGQRSENKGTFRLNNGKRVYSLLV